MGNHFHLLLQTALPNLSSGMRQLNGVYAQGRSGCQVLQSRIKELGTPRKNRYRGSNGD
jgi:hypothetical protein